MYIYIYIFIYLFIYTHTHNYAPPPPPPQIYAGLLFAVLLQLGQSTNDNTKPSHIESEQTG